MSCSLITTLPCGFSITGTGSYSCSGCNDIKTDPLTPKINFGCEQSSGIIKPINFEIYVVIPVAAAVAVILVIFFVILYFKSKRRTTKNSDIALTKDNKDAQMEILKNKTTEVTNNSTMKDNGFNLQNNIQEPKLNPTVTVSRESIPLETLPVVTANDRNSYNSSTNQQTLDVMISLHVDSTKEFASKLRSYLLENGYSVWICTDLNIGTDYRNEIIIAARTCKVFMPLINENWAKSKECEFEYNIAQRRRAKTEKYPIIMPIVLTTFDSTQYDIVEALLANYNVIFSKNLDSIQTTVEQIKVSVDQLEIQL